MSASLSARRRKGVLSAPAVLEQKVPALHRHSCGACRPHSPSGGECGRHAAQAQIQRAGTWRRSSAAQRGASFISERRVMHSSLCGRTPMLHGTCPSQCDPAAVPDGLGYAMRPPSVTWRITARHASRATLASRRSHERGRLKQPLLVYKSTISADHPRCSRRAGNKPILEIQHPTPCTPRGG